MSATPVYNYDLARRLVASGATNAVIAERIGCSEHYAGSLVRKLKAGYSPKPTTRHVLDANLFLDQALLESRLRASCERATNALLKTYGPACFEPHNLNIRTSHEVRP